MWPIISVLFWGGLGCLTLWYLYVGRANDREMAKLHAREGWESAPAWTGKAVLLGTRMYEGPEGLYYYATFLRPGALPLELEVDEACVTSCRRGDRGELVLKDGLFAEFRKTESREKCAG